MVKIAKKIHEFVKHFAYCKMAFKRRNSDDFFSNFRSDIGFEFISDNLRGFLTKLCSEKICLSKRVHLTNKGFGVQSSLSNFGRQILIRAFFFNRKLTERSEMRLKSFLRNLKRKYLSSECYLRQNLAGD